MHFSLVSHVNAACCVLVLRQNWCRGCVAVENSACHSAVIFRKHAWYVAISCAVCVCQNRKAIGQGPIAGASGALARAVVKRRFLPVPQMNSACWGVVLRQNRCRGCVAVEKSDLAMLLVFANMPGTGPFRAVWVCGKIGRQSVKARYREHLERTRVRW